MPLIKPFAKTTPPLACPLCSAPGWPFVSPPRSSPTPFAGPDLNALVLWEQQNSDTLEGLVVGYTHDHPSPGVAEIALEGQPPGEGGAAEHGHQLLRDLHRHLSACHFRLQQRQH